VSEKSIRVLAQKLEFISDTRENLLIPVSNVFYPLFSRDSKSVNKVDMSVRIDHGGFLMFV
jgi:hypothetical protein